MKNERIFQSNERMYQFVVINGKKNDEIITDSGIFTAENLKIANEHIRNAVKVTKGQKLIVYPWAVVDDNDSLDRFTLYCFRSFERWERSNEWAWKNQQKRNSYDIEDMKSECKLAIWQALENGIATDNMKTLFHIGYDAISKYIADFNHNIGTKETQFNSDILTDCMKTKKEKRSTYTQLDSIIRKAVDMADLTREQQRAIDYISDGYTFRNTAEILEKNLSTVRSDYTRGIAKTAEKLIEIDENGTISECLKITQAEIAEIVETITEKAKKHSKKAKK